MEYVPVKERPQRKQAEQLAYRVDDACVILDTSRASLYCYMSLGLIGYIELGGVRRIPEQEIQRLLAQGIRNV